MKKQMVAGALAAALGAGSLLLGIAPAQAGHKKHSASGAENAWRYATYAGTVGGAYALTQGRTDWALAGAGVALLSYTQWKREVNKRHQKDRSYSAYSHYRSNWYAHHGHSHPRGHAYGHYKH